MNEDKGTYKHEQAHGRLVSIRRNQAKTKHGMTLSLGIAVPSQFSSAREKKRGEGGGLTVTASPICHGHAEPISCTQKKDTEGRMLARSPHAERQTMTVSDQSDVHFCEGILLNLFVVSSTNRVVTYSSCSLA